MVTRREVDGTGGCARTSDNDKVALLLISQVHPHYVVMYTCCINDNIVKTIVTSPHCVIASHSMIINCKQRQAIT